MFVKQLLLLLQTLHHMLNVSNMYLDMIYHNNKLILNLFEICVSNVNSGLKYHLFLCMMICIQDK